MDYLDNHSSISYNLLIEPQEDDVIYLIDDINGYLTIINHTKKKAWRHELDEISYKEAINEKN